MAASTVRATIKRFQAAGLSWPVAEDMTDAAPRDLTQREIGRLMDCARKSIGRNGHRDATMILVAYRHGLRASEVCDLQWQQIELSEGRLHPRVRNGLPSVHPIRGDEMRALRKLRRDYPKDELSRNLGDDD